MDDITARRRYRKKQRRIKRIIVLTITIAVVFSLVNLIKYASCGIKNAFRKENQTAVMTVYPEKPEAEPRLDTAIKKNDNVKTCYLTFDDGPTLSVTPRILDILRRYDVKATFFMVGTLIENNKSMARRVYDEGHCLANHSYSHNYSDLYASEENFMNEINKTHRLISEIAGEGYPKIFRFPGGGFNSGSYGEAKQGYKNVLKQNNVRYCDWNALNGDAEGKNRTSEELVERVKKTTSGKEDVVILMHDAATKSTTAEALPSVLEYLISEGYVFKTLDKAPIV